MFTTSETTHIFAIITVHYENIVTTTTTSTIKEIRLAHYCFVKFSLDKIWWQKPHRCIAVYKCLHDLMEVEFNTIKNSI